MKNPLKDPRYAVTIEDCGRPNPMYVARFEGECIGSAERESSAWILCIIDDDTRFNKGLL